MSFGRAELVAALAGLGLPARDWLVHSSGSMVMHGLLDTAGDMDIVATGAAWQRALELGPAEPATMDLVIRPAPGIEIFAGWLGEPLEGLFARARLIEGVPCASLHDVLAFKLTLNRPKDQPHIELLRRAVG